MDNYQYYGYHWMAREVGEATRLYIQALEGIYRSVRFPTAKATPRQIAVAQRQTTQAWKDYCSMVAYVARWYTGVELKNNWSKMSMSIFGFALRLKYEADKKIRIGNSNGAAALLRKAHGSVGMLVGQKVSQFELIYHYDGITWRNPVDCAEYIVKKYWEDEEKHHVQT